MIAAWGRWPCGAAGALAALVIALAAWFLRDPVIAGLLQHPYFTIHQITVHGAGPALTAGDVHAWLGFDESTTVWSASPANVRARLEAHPYILRAAVKRQFPGGLEITVRERRPHAIAVLDDLYYVDRSGALFGPLRPRDSRDLPFITGIDPDAPDSARDWVLRRALRLLRRFEHAEHPRGALGPLSEVHVDVARGVTVFPAAPQVPILLGWGSWSAKLARVERVLARWRGAVDRLARIDARFRNQVVATTRAPAAAATPAARAKRRGRGLET
ncbi:MAG: cell division protein FtsQ/DivIB [Candidatus Binatia bacterium]